MPVVRFQLRNEYKLGQSELYREINRQDDPKTVLDGVAVAGLVGILRQLGDLAEFAGDVFHGLQEQVTATASRSHKLMARVQTIEAALPLMEKRLLTQTSRIHFAYTAGSEWRSDIQIGQNHFMYNNLPRVIMDSYEECRDPPRLHLLDRFDNGGPGSCLKRYSDPTFFRRASGNFEEPRTDKVTMEKKGPTTKNKRPSQRNADFLHSATVSNQRARMPFGTTINEQTSLAHTDSTTDMTLKSDQGYRSNSFDSRAGSAYVECVFELSSAHPEKQESKELPSRSMHHNDNDHLVMPDGQLSNITDRFCQSSPEPIAVCSSCDTSDEMAEILEYEGAQFDDNDAMEMFKTASVLGNRLGDVVNHKNSQHMNMVFDDENILNSSPGRNDLDEVESEPGNYMDALNTIEPESESCLGCQMKHEVRQFSSSVDIDRIENEENNVSEHKIDDPSINESHTRSDPFSIKGTASDLPNSAPLSSILHEHISNVSGHPSKSDDVPGMESLTCADALDHLKVESMARVSNPPYSGCRLSSITEPPTDKAVSSSCQSHDSPAELPGVQPVSIWTNGGLLGLAPSKPLDFGIAKTSSNDSVTISDGEVIKVGKLAKDDGRTERIVSSECSSSQHDNQDAMVEKFGSSHHSKRSIYAYVEGHEITNTLKRGKEPPIDANVKDMSTKENKGNLSQKRGLGLTTLTNGFPRRTSPAPVEELKVAISPRAGSLDQRNGHCDTIYHMAPDKIFNEKFGDITAAGSLTSSPPLEHMKISFHPIDEFDISKLNLKFLDGSHRIGSTRDLFPEFQLVPEPRISPKDAGSDSDDDTFCRSSPYMSDDHHSHHSYSDSERWESEESPDNKNHELCDALRTMSPDESVPTSLHPSGMGNNGFHINSGLKGVYIENDLDPSLSSSTVDLPSFTHLEQRNVIELQYPQDMNPSPPPPPPLQWRVSRTACNMAEDKQRATFRAHEHGIVKKGRESTESHQHKSVPANKQCTEKQNTTSKPNSKQNQMNVQRDYNLRVNVKDMDEKEDFLHQIRARSFNLRRVVTAKPRFSSGPATNGKVTAILEKAIAIRQAVGSDDEEDWSDASSY